MVNVSSTFNAAWFARFREYFTTRHFFFHDGRSLRGFSIAGRTQAALAGIAAMMLCFSVYGVAQAAIGAGRLTGAVPVTSETKVAQMQARLVAMQANVAAIKRVAAAHAMRVEQRQALIAAALTGKGDPTALAMLSPAIDPHAAAVSADVVAPFKRVEARQVLFAEKARQAIEQRYAATTSRLKKLGISADRLTRHQEAMGGPLIAANSAEATADLRADAQFRSLFNTWKKLDTLEHGAISIPAMQPVDHLSFSSYFGVRSDPFRGSAAMHAGVDIPGPMGTPVYATADGIVARAERAGGYGNMIELNHGKGIATRYGHLSKILVSPNTRVKRGQLIALMGSTGRSTGSHLHYEVRIDGHAVNPMPFLQTADYLVALQNGAATVQPISSTTVESED